MKKLLELFPFINKTKLDLESQNKFLNKVTLTGKINALEVAANLFEFTDKTIIIFDELKNELITALIDKNLHKVTDELTFKAQTAIDILIRNLFERTADVGFLATDSVIVEFLTSQNISKECMKERLLEYTKKYSVYNEILVFDVDGNVQINLNDANKIQSSKDEIISQALLSEEYVEIYKKSDIFSSQNRTLMYAQKIVHNNKNIGVLCLCFKLEDELKGIFKNLTLDGQTIAIANNAGLIQANTTTTAVTKYTDKEYTIVNNRQLMSMSKTSGYQGYTGIADWYSIVISDTIDNAKRQELEFDETKHPRILEDNLIAIIEKANDLVEDIADVIINGELIASKQRVYLLSPILDNLRDISSSLLSSIKGAVTNLEKTTYDSLTNDAKKSSHLSIDIMDRNLYERANDCRWWALTPLFIEELSAEKPNSDTLHKVLLYINDLYTVYTNLIIYDKNHTIIASSKETNIIGKKIYGEFTDKTLLNTDSSNYFVSDFQKSEYYDNQPTYIYSASIANKSKNLGGIAIVFDATVEFRAILEDSFVQNKKGFMALIDKERKIISTTSTTLKVADILDIDLQLLTQVTQHSVTQFIKFNDLQYIMAIAMSKGYREYKTRDNYTNDVYSVTFIQL